MIDISAKELMLLIKGEVEPEDFIAGTIKLWEDYRAIPLEEVVDIALFNRVTGKYFDSVSDYTFKERFNILQEVCNGFVHMAGGLSCGVTDRKISEIKISKKYIALIAPVTRNEIEKYWQKPEKELIEDITYAWDYIIESEVSVYKNGRLYFFFDPEQLALKEIRIGMVKEDYYSRK